MLADGLASSVAIILIIIGNIIDGHMRHGGIYGNVKKLGKRIAIRRVSLIRLFIILLEIKQKIDRPIVFYLPPPPPPPES